MEKEFDFDFDLQLFAEGGDDGSAGENTEGGVTTPDGTIEAGEEGKGEGQPSQVQAHGKNQEALFGKADPQAEAYSTLR